MNGCALVDKLTPTPRDPPRIDICDRYPFLCDPRWWWWFLRRARQPGPTAGPGAGANEMAALMHGFATSKDAGDFEGSGDMPSAAEMAFLFGVLAGQGRGDASAAERGGCPCCGGKGSG